MGNTNLLLFAILSFICVSAITFTYISRVGGWASLAEPYRISEPFSGSQWKFESGQMRYLTRYNHCLTIGANPRGLYLSIPWPLRISHPPLFIPWRDISFFSKSFLGLKYIELRLGREVTIPFRISYRLAQKLKTAAGSSWPMESIA
jgi:hypothetical protein